MKQIQKGFTLIELMIVVAIIGILAAVAIPAYQDYVVKAKLSKVTSTIDPVKLALAMYFQEAGTFPVATGVAGVGGSWAAGGLWDSIGLTAQPTIPPEISTLTVTGTAGTATMTLKLAGIKAVGVDALNVVILGTSGSTAITWACDPAGTSTITDGVAKKYFGCP